MSQNDTYKQTQQKKAQNLISSQQKHSALPFIENEHSNLKNPAKLEKQCGTLYHKMTL